MTAKKNIKQAFSAACLAILALAAMIVPGNAADTPSGPQSAGADIYAAMENDILSLRPSVPEYSIEPDLSNVENIASFEGELTPEQIRMIARNGFVVSPSAFKQFGWIYEENNYHRPEMIPAFITTDSMLHAYHCFFDYVLRQVEANKLLPVLLQLTDTMLQASQDDLTASNDPDVQDAALRNVAYFAVAMNLLDGTPPPEEVSDMASADLARIEAHQRRETSAITGLLLDFTQFVPRGHYTRSEELKKYFKTMMWYGLVGFPLPQGDVDPGPTRRALLIARDLRKVSYENTPAIELWQTIYEPTTFFVGTSDDLTFYDYSRLMDEVYGTSPQPDDFADEAKMQDFVAGVRNLRGPGIAQLVPITEGQEASGEITAGWPQFRFMGQRFIPDSRILQELAVARNEGQEMPTGLDVFAAMGSDRALDILRADYDVDSFPEYEDAMAKMRNEMDATPLEKWQSNLYYGWLWGLQPIIATFAEGYPTFMRNDAWLDKSLFTSLGSWTELRHDTVLYAKQSGAECGGDYVEPPPPPKSYVEPNVEFWTRMQWLIGTTRDGLNARDLADDELSYKFDWLGNIVSSCRGIAMKELTNEEATEDEYVFMKYYGGSLEGLMLSLAGGDIISEADNDMAVVVDVHTLGGDTVLQEGTGRVGAIYVVVPISGKLYLTRGGIFTQYEFDHPASDRLTDEQWRQMLNSGQQPPLAEWTASFLVGTQGHMTYEHVDSGC
jgi:hypothetical protein